VASAVSTRAIAVRSGPAGPASTMCEAQLAHGTRGSAALTRPSDTSASGAHAGITQRAVPGSGSPPMASRRAAMIAVSATGRPAAAAAAIAAATSAASARSPPDPPLDSGIPTVVQPSRRSVA
jgi:hypothetical protein